MEEDRTNTPVRPHSPARRRPFGTKIISTQHYYCKQAHYGQVKLEMHHHEVILQVRTKGNCYQSVLCLLPTTSFNLERARSNGSVPRSESVLRPEGRTKPRQAPEALPPQQGKRRGDGPVGLPQEPNSPRAVKALCHVRLSPQQADTERDAPRWDCPALHRNGSSFSASGRRSDAPAQ